MDKLEKNRILKWIAVWKKAGIALIDIKKNELKHYNYNKNEPLIDEMLQWACDHRNTRVTSGLVEQQKIFRKLRDKNIK